MLSTLMNGRGWGVDDPLTEIIAKTVIKVAQTGISDPAEISAQAIKELQIL